MRKIIITGSEGLLGSEICKFFEKDNKIYKLDLELGHDLTDEKFVKKWFKNNHANYLINCFALNDHVNAERKKRTVFDIPLESFSNYMEVNLTALFSVCREFARNNKTGAIVNFSSYLGIVSSRPDMYEGSHKDIGYCVSKAGVIHLTKYLAVHFAPNIRVNCLVPGGTFLNQSSKFVKKYSELTPMSRMMRKNELNDLTDYLCSEKSSYVTGAAIVVDGGYSIW
ncbi:MAG TPA: SDR family oxidoreductase [Nitrosopumilaceae archaeon]|nr:SDR family oxidoreductase [Nitrosopumilaceae archaeon]